MCINQVIIGKRLYFCDNSIEMMYSNLFCAVPVGHCSMQVEMDKSRGIAPTLFRESSRLPTFHLLLIFFPPPKNSLPP